MALEKERKAAIDTVLLVVMIVAAVALIAIGCSKNDMSFVALGFSAWALAKVEWHLRIRPAVIRLGWFRPEEEEGP